MLLNTDKIYKILLYFMKLKASRPFFFLPRCEERNLLSEKDSFPENFVGKFTCATPYENFRNQSLRVLSTYVIRIGRTILYYV